MLKLIIDFYRWLWGMPPLVIQTVDEPTLIVISFGAIIDIAAVIGIIGLSVTVYNNKTKTNKGE